MGRYLAGLGLPPAPRSRVAALGQGPSTIDVISGVPRVERVLISRGGAGSLRETVVEPLRSG